MLTKRRLLVTTVVGVACLVTGLFVQSAKAEPPEGTLRTFAYLGYLWRLPDWTNEDALALTVLPDVVAQGNGFTIVFSAELDEEGTPFPYAGTTWRPHPTHFATKGGTNDPVGMLWWLETEETPGPPPVGANALMGQGPNSDIIFVEDVIWVAPCIGAPCSSDDVTKGRYHAGSIGTPFVIGHAWFSK